MIENLALMLSIINFILIIYLITRQRHIINDYIRLSTIITTFSAKINNTNNLIMSVSKFLNKKFKSFND